MKTLLSILATAVLIAPATAPARDVIHKGDVVVAQMHGEIAPSLFMFLRRAQKAAEASGASAIIFDINTYGGRLDTAEEITGMLNHATIPTYSFINSNAGSAGAIIALATQHIYMAPVSAIGAAAPVLATGEDLPLTQREKTISYWSALIRGSALKNGHNPDMGEAFMDKNKEVKIGDRVIHPKGTLLTLNAQEATGEDQWQTAAGGWNRRFDCRSYTQGRIKRKSDRGRANGLRTTRALDHGVGAAAFARRNHRRISRVQNSRSEFARNYFGDLLRPFFSRALFRGPGRMGSCRLVFPRRGARDHRDFVFRALDHCLWRCRSLSHAGGAALGDDRSLPG